MIKVLDCGFVDLVDMMGSDQRVLDAARVSTGASSKGLDKDQGLINYLMKNEHMTPFEKIVFEFHVKCPIFVARQWFRHRVGCITGDSKIHLEKNKSQTIESLYKLQSIGYSYSFQGQIWKRRFEYKNLIDEEKIYNCKDISSILGVDYKKLRKYVIENCFIENRKAKRINVKGREFIRLFDSIINGEIAHNQNTLSNFESKKIKYYNGNKFDYTPIYKVYRNGVRDVYEITLKNSEVVNG